MKVPPKQKEMSGKKSMKDELVGGFKYFHPYLGKIPMLTNIFQMG